MEEGLLVFPAEITDDEDYTEVLAALCRHAGLQTAFVRARRSGDEWVVVLETRGRLQRARHPDDGGVALDVVAPLLNQALEDTGAPQRVASFLDPAWGSEAGALVGALAELDQWQTKGEVTLYPDPGNATVEQLPSQDETGLDEAVEPQGERIRVADLRDPGT